MGRADKLWEEYTASGGTSSGTGRASRMLEEYRAENPEKPKAKAASTTKRNATVWADRKAAESAKNAGASPIAAGDEPRTAAAQTDYAALADIQVPTPAVKQEPVKARPSTVQKNVSKAVPQKQAGTAERKRTQQRPKSAVQDDYSSLKELAQSYYIPGTGRKSRQEPGFESRLVDTLSGAEKTYGGSLAGFAGLSAELLEALDRNAAQSSTSGQRARQEAENIRGYQAMLDSGRWANGTPLTAEDRETIAGYIQSAQRFISLERERQDAVHAPIQRAADSAYDTARRWTEAGQKDIDRAKDGLNGLERFAVDVGVAGAQMGLDFAPAILTGGGSALVPMFFRSAGGGALAGKDSGADLGTRTAYALGSGALSVLTEQISNIAGPFRKLFGAGAADRIAARLVERFGENGAVQVLNRLSQTAAGRTALAAFGEGFEELAESFFQAPLQRATINPDAKFNPVEAGYEFLVGAALGGLGGGVDVLRRGGVQESGGKLTERDTEPHQIPPGGLDVAPDMGAVERVSDPLIEAARRGGKLTAETAPVLDENFLKEDAGIPAETGPVQAGRVTTIQRPYQGTKPVQASPKNAAPVQVGRSSVEQARNRIEGARQLAGGPLSAGRGFKSILKSYLKDFFSTAQGVEVEGVSFEGKPYLVEINNSVLGKVISGADLSAERLSLLNILPDVVRNGEYIGSSEYVAHGKKAKPVSRYDYFETPVHIDGQDYIAKFDVEALPDVNNFRTHQIVKIDLVHTEGRLARKSHAPASEKPGPVEGTSALNTDTTIAQEADSVNPSASRAGQQKSGPQTQAAPDLLGALLPQGERVSLQELTPGQLSAVEAANAEGTVDVDAAQRAYQVNPEEHIDRRKAYDMGRKSVNAFQFDHPQLHGFYRGAAQALLDDLAQTQRGGEFIRPEGEYYGGRRLSRFTSPAIESLLDEYRLSYGEIEKALNAIIQDKGQENYAAAKRVELVLDDMLSNGFKDVEGRPYGPDEAYIAEKAEIAGSLEAETEAAPQPDLGVMGQEIQKHFGKKTAPQSFLMDFAELHRRILEAQAKGESALTEIRGRDTIGETGESEAAPYEQIERYAREDGQEDDSTAVQGSGTEELRRFQSGDYTFGLRPVRGGPSPTAQAAQEALTALGIPALVVESQAEWTRNGQTYTRDISQAATIAKKLVALSNNLSMDPQTVAGHEAFHFWGGTEARTAFEAVLIDNLDFSTDAFIEFQHTVSQNYLGEETDISDISTFKKLMEEVYAYLAGDLHSGEHEAQLRAMLRDYDAVKAAWDTLTEYGRTHPAEAPLSDSRAAPALTETQGRDTMGETVKEAPYYERRAEEKRTARPETVGDFIERSRQEALSTRKIGDTFFGFRPVQGRPDGPARALREELTALGIPSVLTDGTVEWNRDSVTKISPISEAATIAKNFVVISEMFSMDPRNSAGHEAYHFWGDTEARAAFEDVLWDQIIYTSEAFQEYQNTIAEHYFGEDVDLSDSVKQDRFTEELAAYLAGDLHSGAHEAQLRAMFRDYDAGKAAWDTLTEYGTTHPVEAPLSDSRAAPALTEIQGRDTIGETGESEVTPYEQVGREHRESRQEDAGAFSRRSREEKLRTFQSGSYLFGLRPIRGDASPVAQAAQEALTALGVPSLVVENQAEWNRDGRTYRREFSDAATIAKRLVAICNDLSLNPQTVAGHEAFHFWGGTEARIAFESVLLDNIDFASKEFQEFQDVIVRNYFGQEVDISDSSAYGKLMEEVYAYIAGHLHGGEHTDQLRAMLRDYDAVKAAWDALAEYGRTHPAGAPQMDGLGAADAGGVNTPFDQMQAKTDQFHPVNPGAEARVIQERSRAPAEVPVENPGTGQNVRKLAATILNSPLTSNEMAPIIESAIAEGAMDYGVITDRGALMQAQEAIRKNGYQAAARQVIVKAELGQRLGKYDGVQAIVAYNAAVEAGDHVTAYEVLTALGEASTDAAQLNQAMHLLNRMTPEGKLLSLRRMADRMSQRQNRNGQRRSSLAGLDAEAQRADFVEQRTGFQISDELAADYLSAETEEARAEAWDAIVQDLASQIPNTLWDKWNAWRYTAMLTNPTTHVRNFLGNVAAQLQRKVKNAMGAVLEGGMVQNQAQRTKSFLTARDKGLLDFARGQYEADQAAAMGQGKYAEGSPGAIMQEIQAKRKVLDGPFQWLSEKNSALLDAEDVWFNRPAYVDSFAQALKAKGVTAEEAASGTKAELVEAARAYAVREAQRATFRDANAFSDFVARLGRYEGDNPVAKGFALLTDAMLPFRRTPANVLVRGLEYSPAGLAKAIYEGAVKVRKGDVTAAEMVDHLASGLTGTGVFALGGLLASLGLLALRHGDDDRERNFLRDAGFQDFALQIGGQSYTLSWLSPSSMPLFAGAAMFESFSQGGGAGLGAFLEGMKSVTDSVLETSMLSSLNQLLEGMSYAESKPWYILSSLLGDYVSQAVPTLLGKAASAADPYVRSAYVPAKTGEMEKDLSFFLQGIQRKTPGARNAMQPKIDLWGREVSNGGTGERLFESFLSPGFYSRVSDDALTKELQRLAEATGKSTVYPTRAAKSFKVGEETKVLTAEEYTRYARKTGQTRREVVEQLLNSEGYWKLSDEGKAKAIAAAYEYADGVGKMEVSSWRPSDSHILKGALNSVLPPAVYILYKQNADRDDSGGVTSVESAWTLMEMAGLSDQERGEAWAQFNSQASEAKNPFTGALAGEGVSPEDAVQFWIIYDGKGTKEDPYTQTEKKRDVQEALDLSAAEVNRLWRMMEKVLEG